MTLPTTEVYVFNTSDSFRANPGILDQAFKQLRAAGVNVPLYSGIEVDNPNVGFIVVNWDTYEQHQEVVKAQFYAELSKGIAPAIARTSKLTQVELLVLKSPANHAAVTKILSSAAKITQSLLVFGQTREDENKYIGIYGWDSVQAHKQAVLKPQSQEIISKISSLVDKEYFYYAKLKKF